MTRVSGRPFAAQRSLVVGGSRGLGAVTAKIVAAGGGHPVITYRDNRAEAELVAGDIRGVGGSCDILRYDALLSASEQLKALSSVDCCYYFATPKIFLRKSGLKREQLVERDGILFGTIEKPGRTCQSSWTIRKQPVFLSPLRKRTMAGNPTPSSVPLSSVIFVERLHRTFLCGS